MKEKNNEIIIYATVVLIVVVIIIGLLNKGNTTKYALGEIINEQKEVDDEILRIEKDKTYTLSKPKLLVNPYSIISYILQRIVGVIAIFICSQVDSLTAENTATILL